MKPLRIASFVVLIATLVACSNVPMLLATPELATASPVAPTLALGTVSPTSPAAASGPRLLRLWLPPQFDPAAESPAAQLFQARLEEFLKRRPGLQIEVRIKPDRGAGGLLESLGATNAAAPKLMPDLVALSRTDLESAALKGLLHPLDGLTLALDDPDWYPYADQLARIQNTTFGLPFAGDVLVLVGRTDFLPVSWGDLEDRTFLFPAGSPQALFSLALYLSADVGLVNEQGRPILDEAVTAEVLSFYAGALANGNLPSTVVSYQDDQAVWQAFKEQRSNLVATWTSNYLSEESLAGQLAPLPGLMPGIPSSSDANNGSSISLARGYAWALAGSNLENQALAVELAEFLSASEFLVEWTEAARIMPARPTALASWEDARLRSELAPIAESAILVPGNDLTGAIGPLFQTAIADVLAGEKTPQQAAAEAVAQLK